MKKQTLQIVFHSLRVAVTLGAILIVFCASSEEVLAQSVGLENPSADPETLALEKEARTQLSQMFYPEQYVMSVNQKNSRQGGGVGSVTLPGLGMIQNAAGSAYEILLVVDSEVAPERAALAVEILRRISDSGNINVTLRQAPVLKTLPQPLVDERRAQNGHDLTHEKTAPAGPDKNAQDKDELDREITSSAPKASPDNGQSSQKQEPPRPQPTLFELAQASPDFALRMLLVLWTAIGALLALAFILRRFVFSNPKDDSQRYFTIPPAPGSVKSRESQTAENGKESGESKGPLKRDKPEIVTREESTLRMAKDLVEDVMHDAAKASRVLTHWINSSSENARYAHVFTKNCDIKTLEKICAGMHPSDVKTMTRTLVSDWDASGDENRRVLEKMRSELTLLAAQHDIESNIAERPLAFLRNIDEHLLTEILLNESSEELAKVCALLPVHRLEKLLGKLPSSKVAAIASHLGQVKSMRSEHFEALETRLENRKTELEGALLNDDTVCETIVHIFESLASPHKQLVAAAVYFRSSPLEVAAVRERVLLVTDVVHLPTRAARLLSQNVDAVTLANAVSVESLNLEGLKTALPSGYRVVFEEALARESTPEAKTRAWGSCCNALGTLIAQGLLAQADMRIAREASRVWLEKNAETLIAADEILAGGIPDVVGKVA